MIKKIWQLYKGKARLSLASGLLLKADSHIPVLKEQMELSPRGDSCLYYRVAHFDRLNCDEENNGKDTLTTKHLFTYMFGIRSGKNTIQKGKKGF